MRYGKRMAADRNGMRIEVIQAKRYEAKHNTHEAIGMEPETQRLRYEVHTQRGSVPERLRHAPQSQRTHDQNTRTSRRKHWKHRKPGGGFGGAGRASEVRERRRSVPTLYSGEKGLAEGRDKCASKEDGPVEVLKEGGLAGARGAFEEQLEGGDWASA
ncbi:hypothetical protein FIBSPDRAFT_883208 [Athelia psychrophila]|uniref:Uncharacterized protein n=1 Tax=Athelia psychrophila TaxID=1759441 RepID=A0A166U7Z6_9AGAM|nr:hypothetical protein FIBSPDRAFT_883208 [Fibularhizoctonia sp. CBS 109695]